MNGKRSVVLGAIRFLILLACDASIHRAAAESASGHIDAETSTARNETPGERFARAVREREQFCANFKPISAGDVTCSKSFHLLKPTDPLATPEGRFAHSIKLPEEGDKHVWREGMSPEEYFDALCKEEAGEFIYRTVDNVEGIVSLRPREHATDHMLEHLYTLEDPYGQISGEVDFPAQYFIQPYIGKYQYVDIAREGTISNAFIHYYRDLDANPGKTDISGLNGKFVRVPYIVAKQVVKTSNARYGYTWRGIKRPHDREYGIAGGETIVLDTKTQKVLAVRRGFSKTGRTRNNDTGVWWLGAHTCPRIGKREINWFIKDVLKAAKPAVTIEGE